ncbi:hypothetical protein C8Q76DRAFT_772035 [Earliella scabrosa]|nr:hypothetical protein C8Q76DRAFT_772035 [Earliella scabrosa]
MDLVLFSSDGVRDDPLVINPARANPLNAMPYLYSGAKNKVLAAKFPSATIPPRFICATVVVAVGCHIVWPTQMQKDTSKMIKEILGVPLRGEIERATAFYGTVFGQRILGLQNFTAGSPEEKQIALVFRTYPSEYGNNTASLPSLRGMGATPSQPGQNPSRSLLEMRDKTSWTTADDIGIWDAREYFNSAKPADKQYRHELLTSLPRLPFDLEYGDLAVVYHSVNTYAVPRAKQDKIPTFAEATTALSMNLYGVALLAKWNSRSL